MRLATALLLASTTLASAQAPEPRPPVKSADAPKGFTVGQCVSLYNGLNSLNYAGQQLGGPANAGGPDAKQYKLGAVRMTIALDIAALTPVVDALRKAQTGYIAELPVVKADDAAAKSAQNLKAEQFIQGLVDAPCNVELGHIAASDLNVGDGANQNAIPPAVIATLAPILDK